MSDQRCTCGHMMGLHSRTTGRCGLNCACADPAPPAVPTAGRAAQNSGETPVPRDGDALIERLRMLATFAMDEEDSALLTEAATALAAAPVAPIGDDMVERAAQGMMREFMVDDTDEADYRRRARAALSSAALPVAPLVEPGDDAVERAARAMFVLYFSDDRWPDFASNVKDAYRESARAALVAVLVGAPLVEVEALRAALIEQIAQAMVDRYAPSRAEYRRTRDSYEEGRADAFDEAEQVVRSFAAGAPSGEATPNG